VNATLLGLLMAATVLSPFGGNAHRKTERGNEHYRGGEFEDALRNYTEAQVELPTAPQLFYDIGNVLYQQQDYEGAAEAYSRALQTAPAELISSAAYNLGNARFMQDDYGQAVEAYTRALHEAPSDEQAKQNLELARYMLEQQEQQEQDQSGDGEDDQQEQQDQQDQEENQDQQDQNQDDEEQQQQQDQPQDQSETEDGEQDQPQEGQDEQMTPEQAARLLDSLADQEEENLRQRLLQPVPLPVKATEKDW
jgi:Ca-activated chloride channel family protein